MVIGGGLAIGAMLISAWYLPVRLRFHPINSQ